MAVPKRATGANAYFRMGFNTGDYGDRATAGSEPDGFWAVAAYTFGLDDEQPLEDEPLLGEGRDPGDQQDGPVDVDGPIALPVDQRRVGLFLRAMFGDPQSEAAVGSRGWIEFPANPANNDTITLGGVTWTFVTSGATGNETNIQGSLEATLDQLVIDLNASADTTIDDATYSRVGDRLMIEHDTADSSGDSFTLAASAAKVKLSASTLKGGGLIKHVWHTGATTLPDFTVEREHADLEAGSARFNVYDGCVANTLTIQHQRSGSARATVDVIGQTPSELTASVAGAPTSKDVALFSHFHGFILVDGRRVAAITAGNLAISNNLEAVPDVGREDGTIGGVDPGVTPIGVDLTGRYAINAIKQASDAKTPVDIRYGFVNWTNGAEVEFHIHRVRLPKPRRPIEGPGGIDVTYQGRAARDPTLTRAGTITLWNDVTTYTPS